MRKRMQQRVSYKQKIKNLLNEYFKKVTLVYDGQK